MSNTHNLSKSIKIVNPSASVDALHGPYVNLQEALEAVPQVLRKKGRHVLIENAEGSVDKWIWKKGVLDSDLELNGGVLITKDQGYTIEEIHNTKIDRSPTGEKSFDFSLFKDQGHIDQIGTTGENSLSIGIDLLNKGSHGIVLGQSNLSKGGYCNIIGGYRNTVGSYDSSNITGEFNDLKGRFFGVTVSGASNIIDEDTFSNYATIFGYLNKIYKGSGSNGGSGFATFTAGAYNENGGQLTHLIGTLLKQEGVLSTVIGRANKLVNSTGDANHHTKPVFIIGNGNISNSFNVANTRSNALVVFKSGAFKYLPIDLSSLSNAVDGFFAVDLEGKPNYYFNEKWNKPLFEGAGFLKDYPALESTVITENTIFSMPEPMQFRVIYNIGNVPEFNIKATLEDLGKEIRVTNLSKAILDIQPLSSQLYKDFKDATVSPIIEIQPYQWYTLKVMEDAGEVYFLIVEGGMTN